MVVGTAGHIDHGKTTLVKALTGQDADRLPEEKRRGITIDLGFAHTTLPSGQPLAFIDVPGHERFVRNMVAGVHGMDAVMMVVAADEGVMPQTREHLEILRLLGVQRGLTAITKADLVDRDMIELVQAVVSEALAGTFLEGAPLLVVDAMSGRGLDDLRAVLDGLAAETRARPTSGPVRLPIDRVFTVKGFGNVVTGTLVSGRIALDDSLEMVPAGFAVRVRGLQVHGQTVDEVFCGQRVAVNLAGIDRQAVARGQTLASFGTLRGVRVAAVQFELLASAGELADNTRVHVYAGTAEALARISLFGTRTVESGGVAYAELRLETPLAVRRQDRFLIRSFSPVRTIGGGLILETDVHHKKTESGVIDRLAKLAAGSEEDVLKDVVHRAPAPLDLGVLAERLGMLREEVARVTGDSPDVVVLDSRGVWGRDAFEAWSHRVRAAVAAYLAEHPVKPGMPLDEVRAAFASEWPARVVRAGLERTGLVIDREWVRISETPTPLSERDREHLERVYQAIHQGGLRPVGLTQVADSARLYGSEFDDVVERLFLDGRLMRLEDGLAITRESYQAGERAVRDALQDVSPRSTSDLKDVLGVNRRIAVLFLELLDREHVTRRVGDSRELMG